MGRQLSKVLALQAGEHELYPRIHDKKKKSQSWWSKLVIPEGGRDRRISRSWSAAIDKVIIFRLGETLSQ